MDGWLKGDGCNPEKVMHENADNNKQNVGTDQDHQDEATENDNKNLANILQDNAVLSFNNVEEMSKEEKVIIEDIIEISEHILDQEKNGFKKVDRNGRKVKKRKK